MFRCENCGSGYSVRAASSWESCPRCLARDKTSVPLTFELGWRDRQRGARSLPVEQAAEESRATARQSASG